MTERTVYFVILEYPKANTEHQLFKSYYEKIDKICNEYCFKLGALYIVPKIYLMIVKDLLYKIEDEWIEKGHGLLFKILSFNLCDDDYKKLLKTVSERLQFELENYLMALERKEELALAAFKEIIKTKEFIQIFQLERLCPKETSKLQDLVSILNEKTLNQKVGLERVEVLEF